MPKTFEEFCQLFTEERLPHVVKIGRRYFADPDNLLAYTEEHKMDPFSVGLYLGEERATFQPTSALIDMLAKHTDRRVVVSAKAAWLFLCGRDVLMDGAIRPGEHPNGAYVIVTDSGERVLGFGRVLGRFDPRMHNKIYVKHLLDKGEYLRRER
jgi:ribosome biogenesis protein Nip4